MAYDGITVYYEVRSLSPISLDQVVDLTLTRRTNDFFKDLKAFVEMLKSQIPASDRLYDPRTKVWTISKAAFDNLQKIMLALNVKHVQGSPGSTRGGTARYGTPDKPKIDPNNFFYNTVPSTQVQTRESISESLAKILGCSVAELSQPFDVVKKMYRKKALELHPDRNNGDGSRMSELNSLWSVYNAN